MKEEKKTYKVYFICADGSLTTSNEERLEFNEEYWK